MASVNQVVLINFFNLLGERANELTKIYLLGGSALCLLGSERETLDIDYYLKSNNANLHTVINQLAMYLNLDLEEVPIAEFIPLPAQAENRHRFYGRFGNLEVYIFDLYSIALSKIARGFESDLEDVNFLLKQGFIHWSELESHFQSILPRVSYMDIDLREFLQYWDTLLKIYAP